MLIQETLQTSPVKAVVYILPVTENDQKDIPIDNKPPRKSAQAQEADESLQHVRRWGRRMYFRRILTFKACLA